MLAEVGSNADERRDWALCLCLSYSTQVCAHLDSPLSFCCFHSCSPNKIWWLRFRIPYLNSFSYSYCAFLAAVSGLVAAIVIPDLFHGRKTRNGEMDESGIRSSYHAANPFQWRADDHHHSFVRDRPVRDPPPNWLRALVPGRFPNAPIWNSLLQVGTFRPPGKAPIGPLRAIFHALTGRVVNDQCISQARERDAEETTSTLCFRR